MTAQDILACIGCVEDHVHAARRSWISGAGGGRADDSCESLRKAIAALTPVVLAVESLEKGQQQEIGARLTSLRGSIARCMRITSVAAAYWRGLEASLGWPDGDRRNHDPVKVDA